MNGTAPSDAQAGARPLAWAGALAGVHRKVLACLDGAVARRPTDRRNAKGDAVYAADLAAERAVRRALAPAPEPLQFLSEEACEPAPAPDGARYKLVVDPIDGSDNHARGLPLAALSIAVLAIEAPLHPDAVEAGMVGPLEGGEPWLVTREDGARRGARPLAVSPVMRIEEAFVSVELNHHAPAPPLAKVLARARAVRSYGCASRALALVAAGALDAHIDLRGRLTPESYLAGAALVVAAGGSVTGIDGGSLRGARHRLDRTSLIAASTGALAAALAEALRR